MLLDEAFGDKVQRGVLALKMRLLLKERGIAFGVVDEGGMDNGSDDADEGSCWFSEGVNTGDTLRLGWGTEMQSGVMIMFDGR